MNGLRLGWFYRREGAAQAAVLRNRGGRSRDVRLMTEGGGEASGSLWVVALWEDGAKRRRKRKTTLTTSSIVV